MRISDWSSDVCSSDLRDRDRRLIRPPRLVAVERQPDLARRLGEELVDRGRIGRHRNRNRNRGGGSPAQQLCFGGDAPFPFNCRPVIGLQTGEGSIGGTTERPRSEEHTSELQSLMSISYAVF